jgi:hypothetical protein
MEFIETQNKKHGSGKESGCTLPAAARWISVK